MQKEPKLQKYPEAVSDQRKRTEGVILCLAATGDKEKAVFNGKELNQLC